MVAEGALPCVPLWGLNVDSVVLCREAAVQRLWASSVGNSKGAGRDALPLKENA